MIRVKVYLHDSLKEKVKEDKVAMKNNHLYLELEASTIIRDLLDYLELDERSIGLVVVNKKQTTLDKKLQNGDIVGLFSPLAGG